MSLGSALQIAQSSLASVSRRTDVVARNVGNANDANHVRREAAVVPGGFGRSTTQVSRAALDAGLVRSGLDARSEAGARSRIAEGLAALSVDLHGPNGERAPAAALSRLHDALQTWSASPADPLPADVTLDAARGVARSFNEAAATLDRAERDLDRRIGADVERLNERLDAFGAANAEIVRAARTGTAPPLAALDRRDAALRDIAEIVPVATVERRDGDVMVTTRRGATLFETVPRTVGHGGGGVTVDGVPLSPSSEPLSPSSDPQAPRGRLEAHGHLRTVLAHTRARLDATAVGTAEAFAASGLLSGSDAATLAVPPGYDMATLRNGPPSYADGIIAAAEALNGPGEPGLLDRAADAVATLDARSGEATGAAARSARIAAVLEESRLQAGGVDVDAEMTRLLALERSYEASARIVAVADRMLAELMAAVR